MPLPTIPFEVPPHPGRISLSEARIALPPEQFRWRLRKHMKEHPGLTLAQVGKILKISRQAVAHMVGRLDRPNCARSGRPTPMRDEAKRRLIELEMRVLNGQSAEAAASALGLSLNQCYQLGFRTHDLRPAHGSGKRDCACWRCRKAAGEPVQSRSRLDPVLKADILDWLAYRDPEDGSRLSQARIGELVGVGQAVIGCVSRAAAQ